MQLITHINCSTRGFRSSTMYIHNHERTRTVKALVTEAKGVEALLLAVSKVLGLDLGL